MTQIQQGNQSFAIRLAELVERPTFLNFVTGMVIVNAILLGVLTYREHLPPALVYVLEFIDVTITFLFAGEILIKIVALRGAFFKSGWNVFEMIIVAISMIPGAKAFSVLRALRVLRLFRLLHVVPMMRRITEALMRALPGMGAIGAVLALIIYVAAVMATMMFGHTGNPEVQAAFGDLPSSAFSLFQVMTGDGWSDVVRLVMEDGQPYAWVFFFIFIFVASFAVLNLFIALIVEALADEQKEMMRESLEEMEEGIEERIETEIEDLEEKVEEEMDSIEENIEDLEKIDKTILATLLEMRAEIQALKAAIDAKS